VTITPRLSGLGDLYILGWLCATSTNITHLTTNDDGPTCCRQTASNRQGNSSASNGSPAYALRAEPQRV